MEQLYIILYNAGEGNLRRHLFTSALEERYQNKIVYLVPNSCLLRTKDTPEEIGKAFEGFVTKDDEFYIFQVNNEPNKRLSGASKHYFAHNLIHGSNIFSELFNNNTK